MKAVLHVRRGIGRAKEAPRIAFVFAKENFRIPLRGKPHLPQRGMFRSDYLGTRGPRQPKGWFGIAGAPGPGIAKPKSREEMQRRLIRPAVDGANPDEYVVYVCFGVLDEYVEVAILVEDACMDQLELRLVFSAPAIFFHNPLIGILSLRITIESLHVGVAGRAVEIEVILFDVFAVISFAVGQPEKPLLQDRVLLVPQGQRKAQTLVIVGASKQPVFSPAVRS